MNRRRFFCTAAAATITGLNFPADDFLSFGEYSVPDAIHGVDKFTLKSDGQETTVLLDWVKLFIPPDAHYSEGIAECRVKIDDGIWQNVAGKVTGPRSCEFPIAGGLVAEFAECEGVV